MSVPSRLDSILIAFVGVTKLCNRSSLRFASAGVLPRIGMTPGRMARSLAARP